MKHESRDDQSLEMPGLGRALRYVGRAALLRCPYCGGAVALASWGRLRERCPSCGLLFERGESDYFLGSMMFNLVVAEIIFVLVMILVIVWRWPDVPWTFLQYGGVSLMVILPFLLFPVSKVVWLSFDMLFRPPRPEEFVSREEER